MALAARRADRLEANVATIKEAVAKAVAVAMDVTEPEVCQRAVSAEVADRLPSVTRRGQLLWRRLDADGA